MKDADAAKSQSSPPPPPPPPPVATNTDADAQRQSIMITVEKMQAGDYAINISEPMAYAIVAPGQDFPAGNRFFKSEQQARRVANAIPGATAAAMCVVGYFRPSTEEDKVSGCEAIDIDSGRPMVFASPV